MKPMRKIITNKTADLRAEVKRRQNVQRHVKATAVTKLREEIHRHTAVRNTQMELGRLHEASLRHTGLDVAGLNRMSDLRQKLLNK